MKNLLRTLVIVLLLGALFVTYRYNIKTPWGLLVYFAGIVSSNFIFSSIDDPIFGNQSVFSWVLGLFKGKRKEKLPRTDTDNWEF